MSNVDNDTILIAVNNLVDTVPNDQELGNLVRKLIKSTREGFITIG